MPPSKKNKTVRSAYNPPDREVRRREDPESIMAMHPSWGFSRCDVEGTWSFHYDRMHRVFWDAILPKLRGWESMTWSMIMIEAKKQNHHIPVGELNKCARDRLDRLGIIEEELLSLSISATARLYGFLSASTYIIVWYDDNHGDNPTCVCRSYLKYT